MNIKQIMNLKLYKYMTTDLPMKMKDSHAKVVAPTKINNFSAQFVIIHSVPKAILRSMKESSAKADL